MKDKNIFNTEAEIVDDNFTMFKILVRGLINSAYLSYDGENVRFDDATLEVVFKLLFPDVYTETLAKLKAEKDGAE